MHALKRRAVAACPTPRFPRYPIGSTLRQQQRRSFRPATPAPTRQPGSSDDDHGQGMPPTANGDGGGGGKSADTTVSASSAAESAEGAAAQQPTTPAAAANTAAPEEPDTLRRPSRTRAQGIGLRARVARNRTPEELPRVTLPALFPVNNLLLHDQANRLASFRAFNNRNILDWDTIQTPLRDLFVLDLCSPADSSEPEPAYQTLERAFAAVEWNDERAREAVARGDVDAIERRGALVIELIRLMREVWEHHHLEAGASGEEGSRASRTQDENQRLLNAAIERIEQRGSPAHERTTHVLSACAISRVLRQQQQRSVGLAAALMPNHSAGRGTPTSTSFRQQRQHKLIRDRAVADWPGAVVQSVFHDLVARDVPPHHLLSWLDFWAYHDLKSAVSAEFAVRPTRNAHLRRDAKRPITIMTIPNYNGKMFARAAVSAVAAAVGADLIHLDARTLSVIVGEYLGQDWTSARGAISMLAFRTAELNGRLGRAPEISGGGVGGVGGPSVAGVGGAGPGAAGAGAGPGGEDGEDATMVNIHTAEYEQERSPMEKELQKIRDGARDYILPSVDRWENLKINAALEHVLTTVDAKAARLESGQGQGRDRPPGLRKILIHLDDFVELNMTLEGSLLAGRLRAIADAAWQHGGQVVVVGTSSFDAATASAEFQSTLGDLVEEECHISCPLHLAEFSHWGYTAAELTKAVQSRIRILNEDDDADPDGDGAEGEDGGHAMAGQELLPRLKRLEESLEPYSDATARPPEMFRDRFRHADYFEETIQNLEHMLATIAPWPTLEMFRIPVRAWLRAVVPWSRIPFWDRGEEDKDGQEEKAAEEGKEGAVDGAAASPSPSLPREQQQQQVFAMPRSLPRSVLPQPVTYDIARQLHKAHLTHANAHPDESAGNSSSSSRNSNMLDPAALAALLSGLLERRSGWETPTDALRRQQQQQYQQGHPYSHQQQQPDHHHHHHHHHHHPGGSGGVGGAGAGAGGSGPSGTAGRPSPLYSSPKTTNGALNDHEKRLLSGLVKSSDIRTTFADIHAPAETVTTLRLLTSLSLVRPDALSYGILARERIPGCLLYGPPGTGKTLLARAVAKESGANVLEVTGASVEDMYVGESEKNVRAIFSLAREMAPMVVFIDEADSLLGSRSMSRARPSRRETLNQFLREWDGMSETTALIMVATNRPYDLDDAVLRRLPRKILVDLPLRPDRAAILRILLRDELMDETVDLDGLAAETPLYSGSDLKNLCVAAAMAAVREEIEAQAQAQAQAQARNAPAGAGGEAAPAQRRNRRHRRDGDDEDGGVDGAEEDPERAKKALPRSAPSPRPERRVLRRRHFEKALREVGASVGADTPSLRAIRKFDETYGQSAASRRARGGMGFGVHAPAADAEAGRVRKLEAA